MRYLDFMYDIVEPEAYLEPSQTSTMERFAKTVNGLYPLAVSAKRSILHVSQGFVYASEIREPT